MNWCDWWGPDGRLDTKISQIKICHFSLSYASYDIKCHIMTIDAYDIEICLSKWPKLKQNVLWIVSQIEFYFHIHLRQNYFIFLRISPRPSRQCAASIYCNIVHPFGLEKNVHCLIPWCGDFNKESHYLSIYSFLFYLAYTRLIATGSLIYITRVT